MKTLKITLLLAAICMIFISLSPKNDTVESSDTYDVQETEYNVIAHTRKKGDIPSEA